MRLVTAGTVLGFGLGGFVDGIVLHQIMQWHNMGSAVLPPTTMHAMSQNMVWDGCFHLGTWLDTVVGVWMLWRQGARFAPSAQTFSGQLTFGWGAFNLIEGVVNHHVLGLHHVKENAANPLWWDLAFLTLGAVLVVVGVTLSRRGIRRGAAARDVRRAA